MNNQFKGVRVLITGGLGFIGLNIAKRLVDLEALVTVLTDRNYDYRSFDIIELKSKLNIIVADIRQREQIIKGVEGQDIIINLAGISGVSESMNDPYTDLDINCLGQINLLQVCKEINPQAKIIFSGSQLEYGKPIELPLTEDSPLNPVSFHGIHKLAGEKYHLLFHDIYSMDITVFRISNPYGPLRQMQNPKFVLPNLFIKLAMDGEPIKIFGDGSQKRTYHYIDDLIEAFLLAAINPQSRGKVYNVGGNKPIAIIKMAELVVETTGKGSIQQIPWPKDYKNPQVGDLILDVSRIKRELGWQPRVNLATGIKSTVLYYQENKNFYW